MYIFVNQVWLNKSYIIRKSVLQRSFWYILYLAILARKWEKRKKPTDKFEKFDTIFSSHKFNFNNKSH